MRVKFFGRAVKKQSGRAVKSPIWPDIGLLHLISLPPPPPPAKGLQFLFTLEDFHKIWGSPPKNMGLPLKNFVKGDLALFTPEDQAHPWCKNLLDSQVA